MMVAEELWNGQEAARIDLDGEEVEGWLLVKGPIPDRWKERAVPLFLVPLLPREAKRVVQGGSLVPEVGPQDEGLLRLVAQGRKTAAIARELHIPLRTVERRLEKLRRRFEVPSTADLSILLARLGFGQAQTGPRGA